MTTIGVDFDNTLVCYDELFPSLAREQGLVPDDVRGTKQAVRAHLRGCGREVDWTRLQGEVYGPYIQRAPPFAGALAFVKEARAVGIDVVVISHKTAVPILGAPHDLIAAARAWLERHGFFDDGALPRHAAFFEPTKEGKIARIRERQCAHFVDDLPELFRDPAFPPAVGKTLFDPHGQHPDVGLHCADSWETIAVELLRDR